MEFGIILSKEHRYFDDGTDDFCWQASAAYARNLVSHADVEKNCALPIVLEVDYLSTANHCDQAPPGAAPDAPEDGYSELDSVMRRSACQSCPIV